MANESVSSDHPSLIEPVKEEVHEQVKTIEQEIATQPKEFVEKENSKVEDSPSPEIPLIESKEDTIQTGDNANFLPEESMQTGEEETLKIESPVAEDVKKTDVEKESNLVVPLDESAEKIEDKHVEGPVVEEVKAVDEEEQPKAEDLPNPVVPFPELEEKIEDKNIEPQIIEEPKITDEVEKQKAVPLAESEETVEEKTTEPPVIEEPNINKEEKPSRVVSSVVSEETFEDKKIEAPSIEEAKTDDIPVSNTLDVEKPIVESAETAEKEEEKPLVVSEESIPEAAVETAEKEEEKPIVVSEASIPEAASESEEEKPIVESNDSIPEAVAETAEKEEEKPIVVSEDSIPDAAVEKEEKPIVVSEDSIPDAANETTEKEEEKPIVVSEDSIPEAAAETAEKGGKPIVASAEKEPKIVEIPELSTESVEKKEQVEEVKETEPAVVKEAIPEPVSAVEEKPQEKSVVIEQIEKEVEPKEGVEVEIEKSEETSSDKVEETAPILKEEATTTAEPAKIEESLAVPKGDEVVNIVTEELTKLEENVTGSISTNEVPEKSLEVDNISRDFEAEAVETNGDRQVKKNVEEVAVPKVEVKGDETVQTDGTKSKEEKDVDAQVPIDETKTSDDSSKEEVPTKSTQKQSNSIMGKVKKSLVKAKKAIMGGIGKTPPSEPKGDVKA